MIITSVLKQKKYLGINYTILTLQWFADNDQIEVYKKSCNPNLWKSWLQMWRYKSELWRRSGKSRAYKNYTRLPENKPATKDGDVNNHILTITDTSTTSVKVYVLRFGKAGWDCVLKGNISSVFLCFRVFFLSRRKAPQRYVSQNLYLGIIYSSSIFWNSVRFY